MNLPDRDALSPEERKRLDALPRERSPAAGLEERTVKALQRENYLTARWYRRRVPMPMAAAAGLLLFILGAAAGRALLPSNRNARVPGPVADSRVIESPPAGRLVTWM